MRHLRKLLAFWLLAAGWVAAQAVELPAVVADRVPFFAAALSELLSDTRAFTARAELQLPGEHAHSVIPFGVAMLDGRMRWQLNLEQIKGTHLPAELFASLKQARLDRLVAIMESDKPLQFGFPSMKAWLELPLPKAGPVHEKAQARIGRLTRTLVGKEMVDGHPCKKFKLAVPPEMGRGDEAFVWTASGLKDLPIKLQVRMQSDVYAVTFRNVHYFRPDPRLFVAPADYTRHASVESVLQAGLLRGLGAGAGNQGTAAPPLNLGGLLGIGIE